MIRYALQFNTTSDVIRRTIILVIAVAICSGVSLRFISTNFFADDAQGMADHTYFVGAFVGVIVGWPIVMAFFFAAKHTYGVHKEVKKIAQEDFLTGLLNRREFLSRLTGSSADTNTPPVLMHNGMLLMIDADNFKRINDAHGHLNGDKALIAIASAINGAVRSQDIVSRIGGEEFAVLLSDASHDIGVEMSARILIAVNKIELTIDTEILALSVSIGAVRVAPHLALSQAMKAADEALYRAKHTGKNRVVFGAVTPPFAPSATSGPLSSERQAA